MQFGVSCYPELTPENEWSSDMETMRAAGLTVLRILDFAWSAVEPREGEYDFGWLDRFLALAETRGMKVVLCTPTAAPPQWLMQQYPQIMVEKRNGERLVYGERRACCVNATIYRQYSVEIARRLGERYGRHAAVIGWQIDNELIGPEFREFFECHCPDCAWRFRHWLKQRYPSVKALNDAWGLKFWSMEFACWGEIPTPRCHRACLGHTLDFHRFYSDSQVEYLKLQYDALHAVVEPRQFVSHNSTGIFDRGIDHRDYARVGDVTGWDAYRGAAAAGHGADAPAAALANDLFRSALGKPFWVFETSPDASTEPAFLAEMRARGAEGVLFWLWRTHRANLEQGSTAFCDFDGRPYPGRLEQLRSVQARIAEAWPSLPAELPRCPAAFLFHPDNVRAEHRQSHRPMPYLAAVFRMYAPLWQHGVATDMAYPGDSLAGYKLAVMPGLRLMSREQSDHIRAFVAEGGVLLAAARTAHMDLHGVMYRKLGEPLLDVLGVRIRPEYAQLDAKTTAVASDGERFTCHGLHAEWLETGADVEVLARFEGGCLDGLPSAFTRPFGRGRIFYAAVQGCDGVNAWLARQATLAAGLTWLENPHTDVGIFPDFDGRGNCIFNSADTPRDVLGQTVPAGDFALACAGDSNSARLQESEKTLR
jgi:beta-galactosidase